MIFDSLGQFHSSISIGRYQNLQTRVLADGNFNGVDWDQSPALLEIYAKLGLVETGIRGDFNDFPMSSVELADNWQLLTALRCDHPIVSKAVLSRALSAWVESPKR